MNNPDFIYGIHSVTETLRAGTPIHRILMQTELRNQKAMIEIFTEAKQKQIPLVRLPAERLNKITRKNHQGVIALISAVPFVPLINVIPEIFEKGETPLILMLDRITDVRNFGAIARTAECSGVHAIIVPAKNSAQINQDAMKTSSGALNFIPICREKNLAETAQFLRESGLQVVACSEKTENDLYEVDFSIPTAIVMGSEETGISTDLWKQTDRQAKIPLKGNIESLNVSVATGIILYETVRQRLEHKVL